MTPTPMRTTPAVDLSLGSITSLLPAQSYASSPYSESARQILSERFPQQLALWKSGNRVPGKVDSGYPNTEGQAVLEQLSSLREPKDPFDTARSRSFRR